MKTLGRAYSATPSQPLAHLRRAVLDGLQVRKGVVRQLAPSLDRFHQGPRLLAQDDLIAPAEDLDLVAREPELFRQADRLAVPGFEHFRRRHFRLRIYVT